MHHEGQARPRLMRAFTALTAGTALTLALSACAGGAEDQVDLPPTSGVFDYQLGGPADHVEQDGASAQLDVVVRDAREEPLEGAYSICYVNGFQTQPEDAEFWHDHPDLLLWDGDEPATDPGWPGELILDPSTADQRAGILDVLGPVIDGCADDGFDAVEVDNLDTWTRFDAIDEDGARELAGAYADRAHAAGLAIAQKNSAEISASAHQELGFDFAIAEECGALDECGDYQEVYGEHVLQVEYPAPLEHAGVDFDEVCTLPDRAPLTILRDRDLLPSGTQGHLYRGC